MSARNCYCAFCKHERKINTKKTISLLNLVSNLVIASTLGFLIWGKLSPKILVLLGITLIINEIFVKVRWRLNMVCPHCHFDPILYLKDHTKAASKVKKQLDEYKEKAISSPVTLAGKNPYKNLSLKKLNTSLDIDTL